MDMFLQGRRQCPKENRLEVDRVTHGKRKEEDTHSRRRG